MQTSLTSDGGKGVLCLALAKNRLQTVETGENQDCRQNHARKIGV